MSWEPHVRLPLLIILAVALFVLGTSAASAGEVCLQASSVSAGETDSFDTDVECWDGAFPFQVTDGGDMGAGDGGLGAESMDKGGPMGPSFQGITPKMVIYNRNQWTGDFSALGSGLVLSFEIRNVGLNPLTMRVAIGDTPANNPPVASSDWFVTSDAAAESVPADGVWRTVSFNLNATDMVDALDDGSDDTGTFADVLANVADLRILHSTSANHGPGVDNVTAEIRIDDIRFSALPVDLQSFSID